MAICVGESVVPKSRAPFDDTHVETIADFKQQDAEFRRMLHAAIERGYETCPIGVSTTPSTKKPVRIRSPE